MSVKIMSEVWSISSVKGADKLGLLALADYANDSGLCFPSYDTFAEKASVSRRQGIRIIEKLESRGHIYKVPNEKQTAVNNYVVVAGVGKEEIVKRLIVAAKVTTKEAERLANSILEKRSTSDTDDTNNETTSDAHDTSTSDTHVTPLVTPMSPEPLYNRQIEPSKAKRATSPNASQQALIPEQEQTKAKSRKPSKSEPRSVHPFVTVYREVFLRYPNKAQIAALEQQPDHDIAVASWRKTLQEWEMHDWSPTNVPGMLERFSGSRTPPLSRASGQSDNVVSISLSAFRGNDE